MSDTQHPAVDHEKSSHPDARGDHEQVPPAESPAGRQAPPARSGRAGIDLDETPSRSVEESAPDAGAEADAGAIESPGEAVVGDDRGGEATAAADAGSASTPSTSPTVSPTVAALARGALARSIAWAVALAITAVWLSVMFDLAATTAAAKLSIVLVLEPLYAIAVLLRA